MLILHSIQKVSKDASEVTDRRASESTSEQ